MAMGILRSIRNLLPGYRQSTVNRLLEEFTPNYSIFRRNRTKRQVLKNLHETRIRSIHPDAANFANVENNYVVEFPNIWIGYQGNQQTAAAYTPHAATTPGTTFDQFAERIMNARGRFEAIIEKQKPLDSGLERILSTIKQAKYNKQTGFIDYSIPAELAQFIGVTDAIRFVGAGDAYMSAKQEVLLKKFDLKLESVRVFADSAVDNSLIAANAGQAYGGADLSFLMTDYTGCQERQFAMSDEKKEEFVNRLVASSIGKRELKKVVKVLEKRSVGILQLMGKFMSNQGAGRTYASRQEKIDELKRRLNDYARTDDQNLFATIMGNFTPLEVGHANMHTMSQEGFTPLVRDFVQTQRYLAEVRTTSRIGTAQKRSLVGRIEQKVRELAELRQDAAFTRYPLETLFPAAGDVAAELRTYAEWAYAGSGRTALGGPAMGYMGEVIGGKMAEGTSVSRREKKHAQARLVWNMLSHYKRVYQELGDAEVNASKLAKKCLKGSADEKRQAVDRLFMTVVDANTVNGVPNYNNNAAAATAARAFFGLYKFYKTLERM